MSCAYSQALQRLQPPAVAGQSRFFAAPPARPVVFASPRSAHVRPRRTDLWQRKVSRTAARPVVPILGFRGLRRLVAWPLADPSRPSKPPLVRELPTSWSSGERPPEAAWRDWSEDPRSCGSQPAECSGLPSLPDRARSSRLPGLGEPAELRRFSPIARNALLQGSEPSGRKCLHTQMRFQISALRNRDFL